ncbi:hypothetical protein STCU_05203 [Strigomonas culicis]|uniref:Uncharacterized protein n=1 Tax=Strigomonas culicis TaxID=28005 RepID=S9VXD7_9TRYP|nr:hypothetical protein STCU_05203 [Strigomonas culicis]|eukprot:EPY28295.1 hypothetical protein STCU_05203 [Strigomonas culicis]
MKNANISYIFLLMTSSFGILFIFFKKKKSLLPKKTHHGQLGSDCEGVRGDSCEAGHQGMLRVPAESLRGRRHAPRGPLAPRPCLLRDGRGDHRRERAGALPAERSRARPAVRQRGRQQLRLAQVARYPSLCAARQHQGEDRERVQDQGAVPEGGGAQPGGRHVAALHGQLVRQRVEGQLARAQGGRAALRRAALLHAGGVPQVPPRICGGGRHHSQREDDRRHVQAAG